MFSDSSAKTILSQVHVVYLMNVYRLMTLCYLLLAMHALHLYLSLNSSSELQNLSVPLQHCVSETELLHIVDSDSIQ